MKKTSTILFTFLVLASVFTYGFYFSDNNPADRNGQIINPNIKTSYIIKGPVLNSPLSTLLESFETLPFPPAGWSKINVASGSTGWERHPAGETPVPGFNGGVIYCPPGGGSFVAFCNYLTGGASSNDEWLVTPQLTGITATDSLTFWLRKFGNYLDHMDIMISTTTPNPPSAFTITVALLTFQPADSGYINYKYNIGALASGSNIYIGFRQWVLNAVLDGASFCLDLVQVTAPVGVRNIRFAEPTTYKLFQNYPNPFNPSTKITYDLPQSGNVRLAVYDVLGNEVSVIVNTFEHAGSYTVDFNASKLASGIYFYKLTSGSFTDVKKMNLIK
jgi:hypothetical protein